MTGYIYAIYYNESPVYVGQTKKTIDERWEEHKKAAKRNKKQINYNIHNFMYDKGLENFQVKQLEETSKLNEKENFWIKELHTHITELGYNLTWGGQTSAESLKQKCYQYDLDGKFLKVYSSISEAARAVQGNHANIIKAISGEINIAYNFRWSRTFYEKLEPLNSKHTGAKKIIYQYDLQGNFLNSFDSIKEAARTLNKSAGNISLAASGKRKTAYGFIWSYDYIMNLAGYN